MTKIFSKIFAFLFVSVLAIQVLGTTHPIPTQAASAHEVWDSTILDPAWYDAYQDALDSVERCKADPECSSQINEREGTQATNSNGLAVKTVNGQQVVDASFNVKVNQSSSSNIEVGAEISGVKEDTGQLASGNTCTFELVNWPDGYTPQGSTTDHSVTSDGFCKGLFELANPSGQTATAEDIGEIKRLFSTPVNAQDEPQVTGAVDEVPVQNQDSPVEIDPEEGTITFDGAAALGALNILENACLFPGQQKIDGSGECSEEEAISTRIWKFAITIGTVIAAFAVVVAGYFIMAGKEVEGRKLLQNSLIGLGILLSADAIIQLVRDTFVGGEELVSADPIVEIIGTILLNLMIPMSGVIAAFFFVVGGYMLLTSGGNSSQVQTGWKYMRNAIFGMLVILLSFTIVQITDGVVTGLFAQSG